MHPELITLPGGFSIKTYGFFMMVGFLSAAWFAMRRAMRVKADPDIVLNVSLIALLCGVAGARLFFVVHYWHIEFAGAENKLWAIVNLTKGGLEFLGGFLGAFVGVAVYFMVTKKSLRLYLDILAPAVMWGLAFGRVGCFFNGCCFGGVCLADDDPHRAGLPWAVRFPYHSPAQRNQWEERQLTVPAELIVSHQSGVLAELLYNSPPNDPLTMSVEKRERPRRDAVNAKKQYDDAERQDPGSAETTQLKEQYAGAVERLKKHSADNFLPQVRAAQQYPSRATPERNTSVSELAVLAEEASSLPVHPTQLYSSINAMLLSLLLSAVFYQRKRHGMVMGLLLLLYPITRFILELIRTDNPLDSAGLTVSQFTSLLVFSGGIAYLVFIYKFLPQRSPRAIAFVPPDEDKAGD